MNINGFVVPTELVAQFVEFRKALNAAQKALAKFPLPVVLRKAN